MYQVPLEMICRHDRTAEVCRAAVEEDGWQLENVPEELKTPELCRKALETEAGFGNDFHRGLVQHIPSPEVCMEVLKECRENNPEELYGVAVAIRPEVMNGEMADFLLPLDGRCISILPGCKMISSDTTPVKGHSQVTEIRLLRLFLRSFVQ